MIDAGQLVEVTSEAELRDLLGTPLERTVKKERQSLHPHNRAWIARSPFCLIATAGPDGTCDVSPKGDPPGFVLVLDDTTLAIPERPGNRRCCPRWPASSRTPSTPRRRLRSSSATTARSTRSGCTHSPDHRSERHGLQVAQQRLPVLVLGDLGAEDPGLLDPAPGLLPVAGHRMRPSERLVCEPQVPVADVVLLADLQHPPGVVERGFGAAEHAVHPGALPMAAGEVGRRADLQPV